MFGVAVARLMEASADLPHRIGQELWDIVPVGGYETVGVRVCNRHQNILKLMSSLNFFTVVICFP